MLEWLPDTGFPREEGPDQNRQDRRDRHLTAFPALHIRDASQSARSAAAIGHKK